MSTESLQDDNVSEYNSADDSDSYIAKRDPKGRKGGRGRVEVAVSCTDTRITGQKGAGGTGDSGNIIKDVKAAQPQPWSEDDKSSGVDNSQGRSVSRGGGGRGGGRVGGDRSGVGTGLGRGVSTLRGQVSLSRWGVSAAQVGISVSSLPETDTETENGSREKMNFNLVNDINKRESEASLYVDGRVIKSDQGIKMTEGRVSGRYGGRSRGRRGGSGNGSAHLNDGASIPFEGQYRSR